MTEKSALEKSREKAATATRAAIIKLREELDRPRPRESRIVDAGKALRDAYEVFDGDHELVIAEARDAEASTSYSMEKEELASQVN